MIGIHDGNQVYVYSGKEALVAEIIDTYFKEYDPASQVGISWEKEDLMDKSLDELIDVLRVNEEIDEWSYLKGRKAHSFRCGVDSPHIIY